MRGEEGRWRACLRRQGINNWQLAALCPNFMLSQPTIAARQGGRHGRPKRIGTLSLVEPKSDSRTMARKTRGRSVALVWSLRGRGVVWRALMMTGHLLSLMIYSNNNYDNSAFQVKHSLPPCRVGKAISALPAPLFRDRDGANLRLAEPAGHRVGGHRASATRRGDTWWH